MCVYVSSQEVNNIDGVKTDLEGFKDPLFTDH